MNAQPNDKGEKNKGSEPIRMPCGLDIVRNNLHRTIKL